MTRYESAFPGGAAADLQRMNRLRLQRFIRSSMWLLPVSCLAAGVLLVVGTLAVVG